MGYYDNHYSSSRRNKKRSWLIPAIVGGIVGAVLVVILLPSILETNVLPYSDNGQDGENNEITQGEHDGDKEQPSENVAVNISTDVTKIVGEVAPAVVGVVSILEQANFWQDGNGQTGTGSGVIYKKEDGSAFIVTNHHVIEGADAIEVVLADETSIKARLRGSDLFTDLAVLEVDSSEVSQVIEMGHSEKVKVGEPVIAIGSPLGLKFSGSVTQGIISGKQRAIPQDFNQDGRADWQAEVIQTDAAINPGNSGGALINMSGQLIGINSMKIAQSAVEGIGFAIPIDAAKPIIEQLEQDGEVTRPYIGVEAQSLNDVPKTEWQSSLNLPDEVEGGVYILSVVPMSPAGQVGLERLDVITHLDGEPIQDIIGLRKHLYQEKAIGEKMSITYYRNGKKKEAVIELAAQDF